MPMATRGRWLGKAMAAAASSAPAPGASDAARKLAEEKRRRRAPRWLPFDGKATPPPRRESLAPLDPNGNGGRAEPFLDLAASRLVTGGVFYARGAVRAMFRVCEHPHWGAEGALRIRNGRRSGTLAAKGSGGGIASDGRHASARHERDRLLCWAVNHATRLAVAGREICLSGVPLSVVCSPRGGRLAAALEMKAAGEVSLHAPARPSNCRRNGQAADFQYQAATQMVRLRLDAESHQLELV